MFANRLSVSILEIHQTISYKHFVQYNATEWILGLLWAGLRLRFRHFIINQVYMISATARSTWKRGWKNTVTSSTIFLVQHMTDDLNNCSFVYWYHVCPLINFLISSHRITSLLIRTLLPLSSYFCSTSYLYSNWAKKLVCVPCYILNATVVKLTPDS